MITIVYKTKKVVKKPRTRREVIRAANIARREAIQKRDVATNVGIQKRIQREKQIEYERQKAEYERQVAEYERQRTTILEERPHKWGSAEYGIHQGKLIVTEMSEAEVRKRRPDLAQVNLLVVKPGGHVIGVREQTFMGMGRDDKPIIANVSPQQAEKWGQIQASQAATPQGIEQAKKRMDLAQKQYERIQTQYGQVAADKAAEKMGVTITPPKEWTEQELKQKGVIAQKIAEAAYDRQYPKGADQDYTYTAVESDGGTRIVKSGSRELTDTEKNLVAQGSALVAAGDKWRTEIIKIGDDSYTVPKGTSSIISAGKSLEEGLKWFEEETVSRVESRVIEPLKKAREYLQEKTGMPDLLTTTKKVTPVTTSSTEITIPKYEPFTSREYKIDPIKNFYNAFRPKTKEDITKASISAAIFGATVVKTAPAVVAGTPRFVATAGISGLTLASGGGAEPISKFAKDMGADITGMVTRFPTEPEKVAGEIASLYLGGKVVEGGLKFGEKTYLKGQDIITTRGMTKKYIAEGGERAFIVKNKLQLRKIYTGPKVFEPSTWSRAIKGQKKGTFQRGATPIISEEVLAFYKDKPGANVLDLMIKDGKLKLVDSKYLEATKFPLDKPTTFRNWFERKGPAKFGLPGLKKLGVKGKPMGVSATPAGDILKLSKQQIGKAGIFVSGKGVSPAFLRLFKKGATEDLPVGFGKKPTVYVIYGSKTKVFPKAYEKVVPNPYVKGGKPIKQYFFEEPVEPGTFAIPINKPEVQAVAGVGGGKVKVLRDEFYFELAGRRIPLRERLLLDTKETSKVTNTDKMIEDLKPSTLPYPSYYTGPKIKLTSRLSSSAIPSKVSRISSIPSISKVSYPSRTKISRMSSMLSKPSKISRPSIISKPSTISKPSKTSKPSMSSYLSSPSKTDIPRYSPPSYPSYPSRPSKTGIPPFTPRDKKRGKKKRPNQMRKLYTDQTKYKPSLVGVIKQKKIYEEPKKLTGFDIRGILGSSKKKKRLKL